MSRAGCRQRKNLLQTGDTPCALAVKDAGGTLLCLRFAIAAEPPPENGGCGDWTHVAGTNGGLMRCGARLTYGAETAPYYCAACTFKGVGNDTKAENGS